MTNLSQVLDAVDLEERLKKTLPLLSRQIEGLRLLQETRRDRGKMMPPALRNNRNMVILKKSLKDFNPKIRKSEMDIEDGDNEQDEMKELEQKIR